MKRSRFVLGRENQHARLKQVAVGSITPPKPRDPYRAMIEEALASKSVPVKECPTRMPERERVDRRAGRKGTV